jgi:aminopeptidase-like protein
MDSYDKNYPETLEDLDKYIGKNNNSWYKKCWTFSITHNEI